MSNIALSRYGENGGYMKISSQISRVICCLFSLIFLSASLVSCGSSECKSNNDNKNTHLSMLLSSIYPDNHAGEIPVKVTNTGAVKLNDLTYSLDGGVQQAAKSAEIATLSNGTCTESLEVGASCNLIIHVTEDSKQGALIVNAHSLDKVLTKGVVGLIPMPLNIQSGALGLSLYHPTSVVSNGENGAIVTISAMITSENFGSYNTIKLMDTTGQIELPTTLLTGNSGAGMGNLTKGSVVTWEVLIPKNQATYTFTVLTEHVDASGIVGDSSSDLTQRVINNLSSSSDLPVGILTMQPSDVVLNEQTQTQVITVQNTGNGNVTGFSLNPVSPMKIISNSCDTTINSGDICYYTVGYDYNKTGTGTGTVSASYNNGQGSTLGHAAITSTYYGKYANGGGIILSSPNNSEYQFVVNTKTNVKKSLIVLSNDGASSVESIEFNNLPDGFTIENNECSGVLNPQLSCTAYLVYTGNKVPISDVSDTLQIGYKINVLEYGKDILLPETSSITVTAGVTQAAAQLTMYTDDGSGLNESNPVVIGNPIFADGYDFVTRVFHIVNTGTDDATDIAPSIGLGSGFSLQNTGTCGSSLSFGESCTYVVNFGPIPKSVASFGMIKSLLSIDYLKYNIPSPSAIDTSKIYVTNMLLKASTAKFDNPTHVAVGFLGGNGDDFTPYKLQQYSPNDVAHITYTLVNSGESVARNFYYTLGSGLDPVYTLGGTCPSSAGDAITLGVGNDCTIVFTVSNASVLGTHGIDLSKITLQWVDQDNPVDPEVQQLRGYANVDIFGIAYISVSSTDASISGGQLTLPIMNRDYARDVTVTLNQGYQTPNQNITISSSDMNSVKAYTDIVNQLSNCVLNDSNRTCKYTVLTTLSANNDQIYNLNISNTGDVHVDHDIISVPINSVQGWNVIGGTGGPNTNDKRTSLLFMPNSSMAHIAYSSRDSDNVRVASNNGMWSSPPSDIYFDADGASGEQYDAVLSLNPLDNTLYVSFLSTRGTGNDNAYMSRQTSTGSNWYLVGGSYMASAFYMTGFFSAINPVTGIPYFTYTDKDSNPGYGDLRVGNYNSGINQLVVPSGDASQLSLDFNSAGQLYVAYKSGSEGQNGIAVLAYPNGNTNSTNISSGDLAANNGNIENILVRINPLTQQPGVVYGYGGLSMMQYNGSNWSYLGETSSNVSTDFVEGTDGRNLSFAYNPKTGTPYVAYRKTGSDGIITVKAFNSDTNSWETLGVFETNAGNNHASVPSLAFRPTDGVPCVAARLSYNNDKLALKCFTP
ncbi:MAG: hypothetical protein PHC75_06560 [Burkholderiales bacterium]|nr:hypothetical protein [Burkholderiales bacterium]